MPMKWVGQVKTLYQNAAHTVGIIRLNPDTKTYKLAGYWNKELLQEAMDSLDLLEYRDVEVVVIEDKELGASILLLRSPKSSHEDVYVAVAGKSEATS